MLEKFREAKGKEIETLGRLLQEGWFPAPRQGKRADFTAALRNSPLPVAVIAEYKRASPSRGDICLNLEVEDVVRQYAGNGASAISILTEEEFFKGNLQFLDRAEQAIAGKIPLLRKDFIFDPIQIDATAATSASAILLIVRIMPQVRLLRDMRERAEKYGLQCVVEVFDAGEIALARESGACLIQVNARDLSSLAVDRESCLRLLEQASPASGEFWIQASGISRPEDLRQAAEAGYGAILVGTSLMAGGKPGEELTNLLRPYREGGDAH